MADARVTKDMTDNRPVVLITGCSTGIGRATANYCAARGWRVIATARNLDSIRRLAGEHIEILPLDVADEASRIRAIEEALARAGRIDALVNNAGYSQAGPLAEVTLDEMHAQFETNLFGAFRLAQLVIPAMREQKAGRIINVSSVVGRVTFPFGGLYCGTKHAMEALSDALRVELKPWGLHVIVVEPGGVHTRFGENTEKFMARFRNDLRSAYRDYLNRGTGFRAAAGVSNLGSPPQAVAKIIFRAMTARRPRPRYQATWDAWLAWPLLPLIPDALKDLVISRMFGLDRRAESP